MHIMTGEWFWESAVLNECIDQTESLHHFPSQKVTFKIVGKRSHWQGISWCFSKDIHFSRFSVCAPEMVPTSVAYRHRKDEASGTVVLVQQEGCKLHPADHLPESNEKMTAWREGCSPGWSYGFLTTFLSVIPPVVTAMSYSGVSQVSWMGIYMCLFLKYF